MSAPAYFRITLQRSAIGLPEKTRAALASLGLRRRAQTVFHPVHPQFAGMIMRVKELVAVEEVAEPMTSRQLRDSRKPDTGFYLESRVGQALASASASASSADGNAAEQQ